MTAIPPKASILKRGLLLGTLAGAVLSSTYTALVIPLVGLLLVVTNIPGGKVFEAIIGAGMFSICAYPFALLMGIFPGALIGAVGGLLIGLILLPLQARSTRLGAGIIGLTVGIGIVISAHALLYPGLIDDTRPDGIFKYLPYLFWLGLPGVLVVAGSTWVGWRILAAESKHKDEQLPHLTADGRNDKYGEINGDEFS